MSKEMASRRTSRQVRRADPIVLIILICGSAIADEKIPANFLHGRDSLNGLIEVPDDMPDAKIMIRCAGHVSKRGTFRDLYCQMPDIDREPLKNPQAYEKAVVRVRRLIQLTPAHVNGEPTAVWFNFAVVLVKSGGQTRTEVFPSHLWDFGDYGPDYIGAQRYGNFGSSVYCQYFTVSLWISTNVDAQGIASNTKIEAGDATRRCAKYLISAVEKSKFIPAVHDGRSVRSIYVEGR